jgi:hypothetical protein
MANDVPLGEPRLSWHKPWKSPKINEKPFSRLPDKSALPSV